MTRLPAPDWLPVLQQDCSFGPGIFSDVSLNLLKNPNINSTLLFRADVLYDSHNELGDGDISPRARDQALQDYNIENGNFPGFVLERTLLRRMIPRNPQLDKPILQTCLLLHRSSRATSVHQSLVIYIPHCPALDEMPWYHPRVQALAYLHTWTTKSLDSTPHGSVSLHYQLYPEDVPPLSNRLQRTAHHLLTTIIKHGTGRLQGYSKRVHHDQLVSQQRVQDTYTILKNKHANRLCSNWVESTEPSKHVFEDLSIAAFLIELWRDMYLPPHPPYSISDQDPKPPFPGFVDIGCGNGVLVDTLLREGYQGWGFDLQTRKTWATFTPSTRKHIRDLTLIPAPLSPTVPSSYPTSPTPTQHRWWSLTRPLSPRKTHDGLFTPGTFIISNHADELTPWTPLLASLSTSPFLCIPCCSHNLSGSRFRAPSVFNSQSADAFAPSYFANYVTRSKAVAIGLAGTEHNALDSEDEGRAGDEGVKKPKAEQGDLKAMREARKKQPSAYASLCDWVAHLAAECSYEVEKEMLRLPSTRNVGIVGRRAWKRIQEGDDGGGGGEENGGRAGRENMGSKERWDRVRRIVEREGASREVWVQRAEGLAKEKGGGAAKH